MYKIKEQNWDTNNFNFKVGLVQIENIDDFSIENLKKQAQDNAYRLIYLQTPIKLKEVNNLFYDEKLVYSKIKNINHSNLYKEISSYKDSYINDELYELSLISGEFSRFKLDPLFPHDKFTLLYSKWIENSVNSDYATDVLVYKINDEITGILTYKNEKTTSKIGIIAVKPNYQNYGIGSKLIKHYQSILENNIEELEVITQGINLTARAFYEKNQYKIKSRTYIYHIWI